MCTRSNYEDYVNYKPLNLKEYNSASDFVHFLGQANHMDYSGFGHELFSKAK